MIPDLIKHLADYNNGTFIITKPIEDTSTGTLRYEPKNPFEFLIQGYWFRVAHTEDIYKAFTTSTTIYAYIELDEYIINKDLADDNKSEYKYELKGRDDTSVYTGLKLTDALPVGANIQAIKLFERKSTSSEWPTSIVI